MMLAGITAGCLISFGFAEDPTHDAHSPHSFVHHCVAYTGTHDNDTTRGWFEGSEHTTEDDDAQEAQRVRVLRYTGTDGSDVCWDLIRLLLFSVADTAIVPMQDLLSLGSEARMNVPGCENGNWEWRLRSGAFSDEVIERLAELTAASGR